jgi:putative NIF3 family GTP cyclohydrolase 1 type 2
MNHFNRRKFIKTGIKTAGAAALLTIPSVNAFAARKEYTVQDVIDIILKTIPGAPFPNTVDTLKSGSANSKVTGIITTMFPTIEVIKKAAALKSNFIIAHEPTFYNHTDDMNWTSNNSVVKQKQELLKQTGITVWRFHDGWHMHKPDGIMYGVLKKMNWLQYNNNVKMTFTIPVSTVRQITSQLKTSLNIEHVRLIGNLNASCSKITLLPGAWGGDNQIKTIETDKPDLVIIGELREWETAEYMRDARAFGSKTSMILLGHAVSEEPGMDYLAEWLQPKLEGINVTHVASNLPFAWV